MSTKRDHPREIQYGRSTTKLGPGRYDTSSMWSFRDDPVAQMSFSDIETLMLSPAWEDRVRASILLRNLTATLPDDFPCIYETADSPNHHDRRTGELNPNAKPSAWVVSADVDMLAEVFDDYQALWDGYTGQWGPTARRTFALGRLSGISASSVLQPGATAEDVLIQTMSVHSMQRWAPEHIKEMWRQRYQISR